MIKSRYNTFVSWTIIVGACLFFIILVLSASLIYFRIDLFYSNTDQYHFKPTVFLYFSLVGLAIFLTIVYFAIKIFLVDYQSQSIKIQNFLTHRTVEYKFGEFDGYCDMAINHPGRLSRYYKAVGIIKNKKIVILIDSCYCSNLDELRNGLSTIKYLGTDKSWEKLKL